MERAIEERLSRVASVPFPAPMERRAILQGFFDSVSGLPVKDGRTAEEIIGFDENGLPP